MYRSRIESFSITALLFWMLFSVSISEGQAGGCIPIDHVPFTINTPGTYCFTRDLSTNANTGNAISMIDVNNVVIDLKGFRLSGNGKASTQATGIFALDSQDVTVKNGTVSGFLIGISLISFDVPFLSRSHLVENIRALQNRAEGIEVCCRDSVVKNNQVINTGNSTGNPSAFGIVVGDSNSYVYNNVVLDTLAKPSGVAHEIEVSGDGSVIEHNRVGNTNPGGGASTGIFITGELSNLLVVDNRITNVNQGIVFSSGSSGKYRDNLTAGVATPFTGGTDAGNNN